MDSPYELSRAKELFGQAVTTVQGSDLRKKHSDAFDLCFPHKVTP